MAIANDVSLKDAFNQCVPKFSYTRIADLQENTPYTIVKFERVSTPYGQTVLVTMEGQAGDDPLIHVFLPRRYNEVLTDQMINNYNTVAANGNGGGVGGFLHLIRRSAAKG